MKSSSFRPASRRSSSPRLQPRQPRSSNGRAYACARPAARSAAGRWRSTRGCAAKPSIWRAAFSTASTRELPIVIPSGSCAAMVKIFYRDLLADVLPLRRKAETLAPRVFEFSQFLVNELKVKDVGARFERTVAYHPSCHLLRELGAREEPMRLLSAVRGIKLCELRDREECCGFGGLFSVKFPHISAAMLEDKLNRIAESGAQVLVANDCGCLMHVAGGAHRRGMALETMHLAQVLASR